MIKSEINIIVDRKMKSFSCCKLLIEWMLIEKILYNVVFQTDIMQFVLNEILKVEQVSLYSHINWY